ncbi:hypothetical protein QCA50_007370 [Cerrena zonata]|uniref:Uncharacterized protein n=1 Tax=Cerrena zonata TaxID=2478898 RepID=A0AAW0G846_9APHY
MSMASSTSTTKSTGSSTVPAHPYAAYSVAEWKRQPSTFEIIYGLELPYRAPKSAFGTLIWKWRLWIEVTFALSMLQPWEKVLVATISNAVFLLFLAGLILYFPRHLAFLQARTVYYLLGPDAAGMSTSDSLKLLFTGWSWNNTLPSLASITTREL